MIFVNNISILKFNLIKELTVIFPFSDFEYIKISFFFFPICLLPVWVLIICNLTNWIGVNYLKQLACGYFFHFYNSLDSLVLILLYHLKHNTLQIKGEIIQNIKLTTIKIIRIRTNQFRALVIFTFCRKTKAVFPSYETEHFH